MMHFNLAERTSLKHIRKNVLQRQLTIDHAYIPQFTALRNGCHICSDVVNTIIANRINCTKGQSPQDPERLIVTPKAEMGANDHDSVSSDTCITLAFH